MIGYVTLGANDIGRAEAFYAPIMAELGVPLTYSTGKSRSWGRFGRGGGLSVTRPFDGNPAHFGNGTMVALEAADRAQVDRIHAMALAAGATDEGATGVRGSTFYGAYFRDPEGNKLCIYNMPEEAGEGG